MCKNQWHLRRLVCDHPSSVTTKICIIFSKGQPGHRRNESLERTGNDVLPTEHLGFIHLQAYSFRLFRCVCLASHL